MRWHGSIRRDGAGRASSLRDAPMADATAARAPAANASRRPATTPAGFNPTGALVVAVLLAFAGASPARRSAARARRFFLSVSAKRPPRERSDPPSLPPSLSPPRGPPSDLTRVPRPAHLDHRQARTCSRRTKTTRRRPRPPSSRRTSSPSRTRRASAGKFTSGAFYTLVPIRPRWRGERRFLRTLPGVSLRPPPAFNPRPRCLSTPTDAFQLHPDIRLYGTTLSFCTK